MITEQSLLEIFHQFIADFILLFIVNDKFVSNACRICLKDIDDFEIKFSSQIKRLFWIIILFMVGFFFFRTQQ